MQRKRGRPDDAAEALGNRDLVAEVAGRPMLLTSSGMFLEATRMLENI